MRVHNGGRLIYTVREVPFQKIIDHMPATIQGKYGGEQFFNILADDTGVIADIVPVEGTGIDRIIIDGQIVSSNTSIIHTDWVRVGEFQFKYDSCSTRLNVGVRTTNKVNELKFWFSEADYQASNPNSDLSKNLTRIMRDLPPPPYQKNSKYTS
tara:strand:+ start:754 stop:1215 length:462 start_codon:yes stop_codon:yes gene_type:complete